MDIYDVAKAENATSSSDTVGTLEEYELDRIPRNDYVWAVYAYYLGDYCGDGELIALCNDGKLHFIGLGHCSCYGPIDIWQPQVLSIEDYLTDAKCPVSDKGVDEKVKELLQNVPVLS